MSQYARYFSLAGSADAGVSSINSLTGAITLAAGSGITITPSGNTLTFASTSGGGGTVTSVGLTLPGSLFSISGSPITTSGTLNGSLINQAMNTVFAAPDGSNGTPTFRTLVMADLPAGTGTLTSVALVDSTGLFTISGSPVTTSGTLTLASLNSQTQHSFFAAPSGSTGSPIFRAIVSSDVPTLNQNTTGTAANITATTNNTLTTLTVLSLPGSQLSGDISGNAANINATSNATLITLSALSLPGAQVSGNISGTASNITASSNSTLTTLSALSLPATQVSGILSVANGGTSLGTLTANNVILGNGTSAPIFIAPGTTGNVLTSNGTTWISSAATGGGANTSLSNLVNPTAVNQNLQPGISGAVDLGTPVFKWGNLYTNSGIYGDNLNLTTYANFSETTTPTPNPASGTNDLYFKSDNNLYMLNSSGTEVQITGNSGSSAFVSYISNQIFTDSSPISSASFTTFDNSPAFTFTPTITGTYKVYCGAVIQVAGTGFNEAVHRIINTSGSAALLAESQGQTGNSGAISSVETVPIQSLYTLTAGNTYVFDIQTKNISGTASVILTGSNNPFYMFAEGIGLTNSPGLSVTITTAALTSLGMQGSMTFMNGILTTQTQAT